MLTGRAAAASFVSFYREGMTAEAAAPVVSKELAGFLPISVLMLGMGADMHTASLFPGAKGVKAAMARGADILCVVEPEDQPEVRVTFSAQALDGAMDKHLVIFGDEKKAAIERARTLPPEDAPIIAVMNEGTVHWAA